jgi:hypothetical protein
MQIKVAIAAVAMVLALSAACCAAATSIDGGAAMQGVHGLQMIVGSRHVIQVRCFMPDGLSHMQTTAIDAAPSHVFESAIW